MSKLNALKNIAKQHGDSAVKLGRQLKLPEIEGKELHITRIDWSQAIVKDANGNPVVVEATGEVEVKRYPVVVFAEYPDAYYAGGDALNQTVSAWVDEYDGDVDALNADLSTEGGIAIALKKQEKSNGRTYVAMYVLD